MVPFESFATVSYSRSIATVAESLAVSTQYTNVTDARQTPHDSIGRAYAWRRAAKMLYQRFQVKLYKLPLIHGHVTLLQNLKSSHDLRFNLN